MAAIDLLVDVCVLGGSGSGLSAALSAKESGAKSVLVLDKSKLFGGCARLCGGMFAMGTSVQKLQNCDENIDELYLKHMNRSSWNCDAKLVRRWFTELPEVCAWLESHGVQFNEASAFSGPRRTYVRFLGGGNALINALVTACESAGIQMMLETRAVKLLTDDDGGVTGVLAKRGEDELRISANSVVIATGSVANNKELVDRLYPGKNYFDIKRMAGVPHNTGDGFLMAEEIGGAVGQMGLLFIGPHNHPANMRVGNLMRRPMLVEVNNKGERFVDESLPLHDDWGWMRAVSQDRQKDHKCFSIMDESIFRRMLANPQNLTAYEAGQGQAKNQDLLARYGKNETRVIDSSRVDWLFMLEDDFVKEIERGKMAKFNDLAGVADWIGCSVDALEETIAQYNDYCEAGYDADFLKDKNWLWPVKQPPYYVFEGLQGIDTCVGGISIDSHLRVLNTGYDPIKNLYAAGVCSSGWTNNFYSYFGTCLSLTMFSGYAAGKEAARNAQA